MPTTVTIPYPLGSDPSGVVLYTDLSNVPQTGNTYTLKQNGTQVSDSFTYITDYSIDMGFLTTDASYLAYYNAFSSQITANNVPIVVNSGPNLVFNGAMTTDTSGNIYTICEFVYNVTVNIFDYTDFDTGIDYYNQQTGNTGDHFPRELALVKIDPFYGTLQYLLTGVNANSFILDPTRTYLYYLVEGGVTQQKTLIKKISLSNGTESEVYRDENFVSTPYSMTMDSLGNLYVAENYGRILKVVPSTGTAVVYATFEYDLSQQPNYPTDIRYGKPQAITCDSSDNIYVTDNGSSIQNVSLKCMLKIPYNNTPGTNYRPATTAGTYDAIPGINYQFVENPFHIEVDDLNHLYVESISESRLYKIDMGSPSLDVSYNNLSPKAKGPNNNILCSSTASPNIQRIAATTYTFINTHVSDYSGQNYVDLSLNDGTSDLTGVAVRVYDQLPSNSSDSTLAIFTIEGTDVLSGGSVTVSYTTTSVSVFAMPTDSSGANYFISGNTGLQTGPNTVTVVVTAYDGSQTTYTATVNVEPAPSSDSTLAIFTIEGTDVLSGGSVTVSYTTTSVSVFAMPTDSSGANCFISGNTGLQTGPNTVTVVVTAYDGSQTTYTATVNVADNIVCFREDTKILCLVEGKDTYIPIQSMRNGTLVKTHLHGYVPVESIGYSKIYNPADSLRSKNRLYKLKQNRYPELTAPLYLTGCHSVLTNLLSHKETEDTIGLLGRVFITDDKYRLMACIDERAKPYAKEGLYTIWHFSLEHVDYYMNYGVYANGLLVESCSRRMMREYSGMTPIKGPSPTDKAPRPAKMSCKN